MISDKTANVIIWVVTAVWVVNIGAAFFVQDYKPSEAINGIFMAIVGGAFALRAKKDGEGGSHKK